MKHHMYAVGLDVRYLFCVVSSGNRSNNYWLFAGNFIILIEELSPPTFSVVGKILTSFQI